MQLLIVSPVEQAQIQRLAAHAEANRISHKRLKAIAAGKKPPPGDDDNFSIMLPGALRVVYTIEEQQRGVWARHLSACVIARKLVMPTPEIVSEICRGFGFVEDSRGTGVHSESWHVWIDHNAVVNVLQFLD